MKKNGSSHFVVDKYREYEGRFYAVLTRKTEISKTESCVFCSKNHLHGKGDGHRIAHCSDEDGIRRSYEVLITVDSFGKQVSVNSDDGYYIETMKRSKVKRTFVSAKVFNSEFNQEKEKKINNMVRLFKDGNALALQTDIDNEAEFTKNFAIALEEYIISPKFEGTHEISFLLKAFAEVCCKIRGYKAEVKEQRLFTVGDVNPAKDSLVSMSVNGKAQNAKDVA